MSASFWDWSCAVYARPGVEAAALALQDVDGLDVNLLLWAAWRAHAGETVDEAAARAAWAAAAPLAEGVVAPLRAARRALKGAGADALRARVKACELDAERLVQDALCAFGGRPAAARTGALDAGLAAAARAQGRDPASPGIAERMAVFAETLASQGGGR